METRIYVSRKDLYHWKEKLEMIMIMAINLLYIRGSTIAILIVHNNFLSYVYKWWVYSS